MVWNFKRAALIFLPAVCLILLPFLLSAQTKEEKKTMESAKKSIRHKSSSNLTQDVSGNTPTLEQQKF